LKKSDAFLSLSRWPVIPAIALALALALGIRHLAFAATPGAQAGPSASEVWTMLASALAFLLPAGLTLLYAAALSERGAAEAATAALVTVALVCAGYLAVGFAFQFGGVALVSNLPGLSDLYWEWSALDKDWGPGWGIIGLSGFLLAGPMATPSSYTLFLSQLPMVASAAIILVMSLRGRVLPVATALGTLLMATVIYPIIGNWVWGGGWLTNIGRTLLLGHGFVDYLGAGTVHLTGAAATLAGILAFNLRLKTVPGGQEPVFPVGAKHASPLPAPGEEVPMPPAYLPVLAILGATLAAIGGMSLVLSVPLLQGSNLAPSVAAVNLLLAMAGGTLAAGFYSWFTTGRLDTLMSARGLVSGLAAGSAAAPFVPAWAALVIGTVAGLFLPSFIYVIGQVLHLDDPTAAIASHGFSGLWGLLALGLFADGQYGLNWNGVGPTEYLGIVGQGVSGYLTASGFAPDWPAQLYAQLTGAAAIVLFAFGTSWLLFRGIGQIVAAWESTGLEFGPIPEPAVKATDAGSGDSMEGKEPET
jgi:Amt family ammonium transporter